MFSICSYLLLIIPILNLKLVLLDFHTGSISIINLNGLPHRSNERQFKKIDILQY
ncbi:hypothetical protein SAMN05444146_1815 [Flavobacterium johnsoniae]|uniref:Uncharacterized protein n=1 Tax=Flavobacterium defluvii TaxID=370979 RepID=A0A1M5J5U3_9FLAO|nr:hypothetical protein SAMN05444481_10193 [Flavobacterium frigidimaris]SHG35580.1 hypothetical protein SAMN05443663_102610 [Flavobacterium defluvii]SHK65759.1 hypothetical protein SAMN05444146_1815 [Flavobacterium johnsoniae]STO18362.1 Uncharacterised protein [Flavobacterium hibernum]